MRVSHRAKCVTIQWRIQRWGGGGRPPPLFLDQTEARWCGSGPAIPFYGN